MFQALERAQQKVFPGAVTVPIMQTGATDSAQLRAKGVQAYDIAIPESMEEARRIHYGEAKERGIRGHASSEDANALRDEGIEVVSLPVPALLKGPVQ